MLCNCIIRGSLSIISQGSQLLVTPANPFAYAISEISYSANQIGKDIQTDNVMNYLNEGEYFLKCCQILMKQQKKQNKIMDKLEEIIVSID